VYVTGFGFTAAGSATGEGQLTVFDEKGRLLRQVPVHPSSRTSSVSRFTPTPAFSS
jgi:hypothetical protein